MCVLKYLLPIVLTSIATTASATTRIISLRVEFWTSTSTLGTVYVGDSGQNTIGCGLKESPCRTIGYSIKHRLRKTGGSVFINASTTIVESEREDVAVQYNSYGAYGGYSSTIETTSIVALREPSGIQLVGLGTTPAVVRVKSDYFIVNKGKLVDKQITLINLHLILNGGLFLNSVSSTTSASIMLSLKNSIIEQRSNPQKDDFAIIFLLSDGGGGKNCRSRVAFENCAVQKFNIPDGRIMNIYRSCDSELTMVNTTIKNNKLMYGFLNNVRHNKFTMKLINVTAFNNSVGDKFFGDLFSIDGYTNGSVDVFIGGCAFNRNRVTGSLISVLSDSSVSSAHTSLVIEDTHFEENDVTDSVIDVRKSYSKDATNITPFIVNINKMTAKSNSASVINIDTRYNIHDIQYKYTMKPQTLIIADVRNCNIVKNKATVRGGAITVLTTAHPMTVKLNVASCTFEKNFAGSTGGGIYSTGLTEIKNSTFNMNEAKVGGAAYLASVIGGRGYHFNDNVIDYRFKSNTLNAVHNCTFISKTSIFYNNANLKFSNVSMNISYNGIETTEMFKHDSAYNLLEIEHLFMLNCGINKNLALKTKKKKFFGDDTRFLSFLSAECDPCDKGTYSISQGSAQWVSADGRSTDGRGRTIKGSKSHLDITNITCSKCPMGGNCEEGAIRNRPNYWGYKVRKGVEFSPCPNNYCSNNSTDINNCSANRTGDLCGQCVANKTLTVTLSCVDPDSCSNVLMIVAAVLIPLFLILFYFVKEDVVPTLKKKLNRVKKCVTCDEDEDDQDEDEDDGKSILARLKLLFYYFQIQSLIYIGNRYGGFVKSVLLEEIKSYVDSIAMLNFSSGRSGSFVNTIQCLFSHSTFVQYRAFSLLLKLLPIIFCLFAFLFMKLFVLIWNYACTPQRPLPFNHKKILLKFLSTAFQILMLFFISISSDLVQLLNCVYIKKHDEKVAVLFGDAKHICLQAWQYVPLLLLILYVLPFCFFLYIGSSYLKKNRFFSFSVMILFPWSFVYYYLVDKCQSCKRYCNARILMRDAEEEEPNTGEEPGQELHSISGEQSSIEVEETADNPDDSSECFFEIIQENYNDVLYWPTIVALRNLAVTSVPLYFKHNYSKTMSMTLVLFVYFSLLVSRKPFKDYGMTVLEAITMSMLILLGVSSMINTTYLTSTDDNILYFLKVVDVLRYIFFFVPVLALIILLIVEKVNDSQNKESTTENSESSESMRGNEETNMELEEDNVSVEGFVVENLQILDTQL